MKKQLAIAGITFGSIIGGVAVGATLFTPNVASAQEAEDGTTTEATEACEHPGGRRGGPGLDAAAEAIGITVEELRAALEDGASIADVAALAGVEVQTVIDAMVADAGAHLAERVAEGELSQEAADEKLAEITERITAHVNGERPARPAGGRRGR